MTGNIWIDLELSLADVEAELRDMSGPTPSVVTVTISWLSREIRSVTLSAGSAPARALGIENRVELADPCGV